MSIGKSRALAEKQIAYKKKRTGKKGIFNRPEALLWFGAAFLYGVFLPVICLALGEPHAVSGNRVLTYENAEHVWAENESPCSYQVTMSTEWSFDGGSLRSVDMYVENAAENSDTVYFVLAPVNEPDTILFLSPELKPGDALTEISLERFLPPGEYDCVVTYYMADASSSAVGIPVNVQVCVGLSGE